MKMPNIPGILPYGHVEVDFLKSSKKPAQPPPAPVDKSSTRSMVEALLALGGVEIDPTKRMLDDFLKRDWPIIPCEVGGKKPLTIHGFKDASKDPDQVKAWQEKYPSANWGIRTGSKESGGAGLVVIDIDLKSGGISTWEQLREKHIEPLQTVTVRTGSGGSHLYFKYPSGRSIKSGTGVLGPGIDVRADGGYVVAPPSKTTQAYVFELDPETTPIDDLPQWVLDQLDGHIKDKAVELPQPPRDDPETKADRLRVALGALNALKKNRADNYQEWLEVGMSLHELGQAGLIAWDSWSKQSDKYKPGACAQKWATFSSTLQLANKISFGSLIHWAEEDGCTPFIRPAPKGAKPSHYITALDAFGYKFSVNDMNDMIYLNGNRMSDLLMSKIMTDLREHDYKSKDVAVDAMSSMALEHKFHPIKDYLNSLEWKGWKDGDTWNGVDHIKNLCEYIQDKDNVFPYILRKWLVGAVGRVLGSRPGQQHPMLVLDGPQGIGKSRFVWWLGSPLPAFYIQNAINTNDKDFLILLCSKWVWEVEELGATLRKSDIESLKAFLTKEVINVRKPYGHNEIIKYATASFIGTINSSGGFLADPTGSRRFRVCTLTKIDWDYSKNIDVNQVWAQAVALFKGGETWELDRELEEKMIEINNQYEVDDPIQFDIFDTFNVEPSAKEYFTATAQIIHKLRDDGKIVGSNDVQVAQRIANVLARFGCENRRKRIGGHQTRVWLGVWLKV
jgi:hypothetical protein